MDQDDFQLERKLQTNDWSIRVNTSILGMNDVIPTILVRLVSGGMTGTLQEINQLKVDEIYYSRNPKIDESN